MKPADRDPARLDPETPAPRSASPGLNASDSGESLTGDALSEEKGLEEWFQALLGFGSSRPAARVAQPDAVDAQVRSETNLPGPLVKPVADAAPPNGAIAPLPVAMPLPRRSPPVLMPASTPQGAAVVSVVGHPPSAESRSAGRDVQVAPYWVAVSSSPTAPSLAPEPASMAQHDEVPRFVPDEPLTIDVDALVKEIDVDTLVKEYDAARRTATIRRAAGLAALAASVVVIGLLWGLPRRTESRATTAFPPDSWASATAVDADSSLVRQTGVREAKTSASGVDYARGRATEPPSFDAVPASVEWTPAAIQQRESSGASVSADRSSILVNRVQPQYPPTAVDSFVGSGVELDIDIDEKGRVSRALVVSGPGTLRDAARAAVLQWQYEPALRNGAPTASRRRVRVSFVPEP